MISMPCQCMSVHVRACEYHVREIMPRTCTDVPRTFSFAQYKVTMTKKIPATMVKGRNKTVGDKDVCTLIGQTNKLVIMYVIK